jgi:hypothetical protein
LTTGDCPPIGLLDDALAEVRLIRNRWFEATWTRDVIARLNRMRIAQPDVGSDENGNSGVTVEPTASRFDASKGKTYALLIGISEYGSKRINPLHWADKDAEAFGDYLTSARGGKLNPDRVQLLRNEKATRDGIEKAIRILSAARPAGTTRLSSLSRLTVRCSARSRLQPGCLVSADQ